MSAELPGRLAGRISATSDGCWIWQGSAGSAGYGQVRWRGRQRHVHRLIFELLVGEVPAGLVLDHLCRTTKCCNPAHLEPVTNRVNVVERGVGPSALNAVKTHCPAGHPYSATNTSVRKGKRHCRLCHRVNQAAYVARRKAGVVR